MRHETLWAVTFHSNEGTYRTLNVACSDEQLIETLKDSMWWRSKNFTLTKIERNGSVRIAPSVESPSEAKSTPVPTCIT